MNGKDVDVKCGYTDEEKRDSSLRRPTLSSRKTIRDAKSAQERKCEEKVGLLPSE